jgi:hypothetical protein
MTIKVKGMWRRGSSYGEERDCPTNQIYLAEERAQKWGCILIYGKGAIPEKCVVLQILRIT